LSQFKKISPPPENQKFNYLGISKSLKLHISLKKILSISLKLCVFHSQYFGMLWVNLPAKGHDKRSAFDPSFTKTEERSIFGGMVIRKGKAARRKIALKNDSSALKGKTTRKRKAKRRVTP